MLDRIKDWICRGWNDQPTVRGKYGSADMTWNDRIVLYLKDCGITAEEIEAFRTIMLDR